MGVVDASANDVFKNVCTLGIVSAVSSKKTFDCYCPRCGKYVGTWWHYSTAERPAFTSGRRINGNNLNGHPYCSKCDEDWSWSDLNKKEV